MAVKKSGANKGVGTGGSTRRRRRPPELLAGIDVGSTAMRMKIAEYAPEAPIRVIEELTYPISTGADSFRHQYILPETLTSICCGILDKFMRLLDDYGVQHRRAVGSSAIREATNREILVDRIRHSSGLELEILDAVEESRLAYQALLPWLRQHPNTYSMALNLGGGSTEIMILRGEDLQIGGAKHLGTARLFHAAAQGGSQNRAELLRAMAANMVNSTSEAYRDYNITEFFLINRILYRAFRNDHAAERHESDFVLSAEALRERVRDAMALSPLELGDKFNMGLAEIELLVPAMVILDNFVAAASVETVTFTDTEMLTGLLLEMGMIIQGQSPLMAFRRQMVRSARAVGEQYFYDRTHSRAVTEFALCLFDALRGLLDLDDKDRLLLEVASVLHDIGSYVSERRHERHSAYLIRWSNIVGLNENDRVVASQIAFYHRGELPSSEHPGFTALSREERIRVSKLAGILRMADVLDRGHAQDVRALRAEVQEDKLVLYLEISGDLGIIQDALPRKSDLLSRVTGLPIVLHREMPRL